MAPILRRLITALLVLGLGAPARGTWSIVAVDLATGEVAIASATCLAGFNLKVALPVVVVGKGAGAAQSFVDQSGTNRAKIFAALKDGVSPAVLLGELAATDFQHNFRQYGIVDLVPGHLPLTFTGNGAGNAKAGVAGQVGSVRYAIQGNLLTGQSVVGAARAALLGTPGDLGERVLAAMEAARALGGDGRCSCTSGPPTSCGAPPPGFTKSAHTAFFIVARAGDTDGVCNTTLGCASGAYYLALNAIGGPQDPDPVLVLYAQYAAWRTGLAGVPDHHLSTVVASADRLPADGLTQTTVRVELVDIDGVPLVVGGAVLHVTALGVPAAISTPVDAGDGSYHFTITPENTVGQAEFEVRVDLGGKSVTLAPNLKIKFDAPAPLHAGFTEVSAAAGATVPFTLHFGPTKAGDVYIVLASAAGTAPGVPFGAGELPLVFDGVLQLAFEFAGSALLPGTVGVLDGTGRAVAAFAPPPGLINGLVGATLNWSAVAFGAPEVFAPPVALAILP